MIPPAFVHSQTGPGRYYCRRCVVYGYGESCWLCGSASVTFGFVPAEKVPTSGGRTGDG